MAEALGDDVMVSAHPAPSAKIIRFGSAGRAGSSLITALRNTTTRIGLSANCPPRIMRIGNEDRKTHVGNSLSSRKIANSPTGAIAAATTPI